MAKHYKEPCGCEYERRESGNDRCVAPCPECTREHEQSLEEHRQAREGKL